MTDDAQPVDRVHPRENQLERSASNPALSNRFPSKPFYLRYSDLSAHLATRNQEGESRQ